MTEESKFFMGIDVSKDTLDIYYNEKHFKIKNENRSIANFIKLAILDSAKIKLCVLESTGGYEKLVMKLLQQSRIKVHRAHRMQYRSFLQSELFFNIQSTISALDKQEDALWSIFSEAIAKINLAIKQEIFTSG